MQEGGGGEKVGELGTGDIVVLEKQTHCVCDVCVCVYVYVCVCDCVTLCVCVCCFFWGGGGHSSKWWRIPEEPTTAQFSKTLVVGEYALDLHSVNEPARDNAKDAVPPVLLILLAWLIDGSGGGRQRSAGTSRGIGA